MPLVKNGREKEQTASPPKCQAAHVEILDQIRPTARLLWRLTSLAELNRHQTSQRTTRKPPEAQQWREVVLSTGERARREDHPPQGRTGLRRTASKAKSASYREQLLEEVVSGSVTHTRPTIPGTGVASIS